MALCPPWPLTATMRAQYLRTLSMVRPTRGIGGGGGSAGESAFATVLVAGVVGLSIMFQGIQAVALPMVQEFGYTR